MQAKPKLINVELIDWSGESKKKEKKKKEKEERIRRKKKKEEFGNRNGKLKMEKSMRNFTNVSTRG